MVLKWPRLPQLRVKGQPLFVAFRRTGGLLANRPFPASNITLPLPGLGHYQAHVWVTMPNYVHLLATPLVSAWNWQDDSFDRLVRSGGEFQCRAA